MIELPSAPSTPLVGCMRCRLIIVHPHHPHHHHHLPCHQRHRISATDRTPKCRCKLCHADCNESVRYFGLLGKRFAGERERDRDPQKRIEKDEAKDPGRDSFGCLPLWLFCEDPRHHLRAEQHLSHTRIPVYWYPHHALWRRCWKCMPR